MRLGRQGGLGVPFFDVSLNFLWPPGITDPGGPGLTFADHLGVPFGAIPLVDSGPQAIRFQVGPDFPEATIERVDLQPIPEPSAALLLGLGAVALGARRAAPRPA